MSLSPPPARWRRTSPRTSRVSTTTFRTGLAENPSAILHISLFKLSQLQTRAANGHGPRLLRNLLLSGVLNRALTQVSRAAPPSEVLPTTAPTTPPDPRTESLGPGASVSAPSVVANESVGTSGADVDQPEELLVAESIHSLTADQLGFLEEDSSIQFMATPCEVSSQATSSSDAEAERHGEEQLCTLDHPRKHLSEGNSTDGEGDDSVQACAELTTTTHDDVFEGVDGQDGDVAVEQFEDLGNALTHLSTRHRNRLSVDSGVSVDAVPSGVQCPAPAAPQPSEDVENRISEREGRDREQPALAIASNNDKSAASGEPLVCANGLPSSGRKAAVTDAGDTNYNTSAMSPGGKRSRGDSAFDDDTICGEDDSEDGPFCKRVSYGSSIKVL